MIKGYVSDREFGYGVSIGLVNETEGQPRSIVRLDDNGWFFEPIEPMAVTRPTMRLDDATARALLDALTRHYHGAEDTRALRRDYDGERDRVDHLTESIVGLAHRVAGVADTLATGSAQSALAPMLGERISS